MAALFCAAGPTPPAGRRVLPPLNDADVTLRRVSEILSRKSSRKKGGPAPAPPRRTTSCRDTGAEKMELDTELKSRMKLQKAKIESSTIAENENTYDGPWDNSALMLTIDPSSRTAALAPRSKQNTGSPKFISRTDGKDKSVGGDDGQNKSEDTLKMAQIDKSKYLISEANARKFDKADVERSSGRKKSSLTSADSDKQYDKRQAEEAEQLSQTIEPSPQIGGQYPKKAIPLPQNPSVRKKVLESSRPELKHSSVSTESGISGGPVPVGKLDVANVAKAINRYGTIPKGVRIGAYLASMEHEQNNHNRDLPTVEDHDSGTDTASVISCPPMNFNGQVSSANSKPTKDDSDPGIKPEPNVKPSSVVKSQSTHVIADNMTPQAHYAGVLQRHKSDLTSGKANCISSSKTDLTSYKSETDLSKTTEGQVDNSSSLTQKPKPSPRFSRNFGDANTDQPMAPFSQDDLRPGPRVPHKPFHHPQGSDLSQASDGVHDQNSLPPRPPFPVKSKPTQADCAAKDTDGNDSTSFGKNKFFQGSQQKPKDDSSNAVSLFKTFGKVNSVKETNLDLVNTDSILGMNDLSKKPPDDLDDGIYKPVIPLQRLMQGNIKASLDQMERSLAELGTEQPNDQPSDSESSSVSKDSILQASSKLKSCIDKLAVAGNKSSTNFMLLSEEVQAFYALCCRYIDSLPPHAKFHARELLSRLQLHSQNLKTYTSSTPSGGGHLLDDIQSTSKEIMHVIDR